MANTYEALRRASEEYRIRLEEKQPGADAKTFGTGEEDQRISTLPVETFRTLRHNILTACNPCQTPVLLFTSPLPKDGNSTVLVNFARCLAAGGEQVTLVDGNLHTPTLHDSLGAENRDGVSELLARKRDAGQLARVTRLKNISLVSAGVSGPAVSCPFDPSLIRSLIDGLRSVSGWVLFDSPSINTANDAIALSREVDGVVLVVRAEKTRWEAARHAVDRLKGAGGNIMGVVLNNRRMPIPAWIYRRL